MEEQYTEIHTCFKIIFSHKRPNQTFLYILVTQEIAVVSILVHMHNTGPQGQETSILVMCNLKFEDRPTSKTAHILKSLSFLSKPNCHKTSFLQALCCLL